MMQSRDLRSRSSNHVISHVNVLTGSRDRPFQPRLKSGDVFTGDHYATFAATLVDWLLLQLLFE